jgi:hypothetical protein
MRKLTATLFLAAAMAPGASMTGWISDASCGASNANGTAASRECAKNCLNNGAAAVFVSDADGKVYKIEGKVDAKKHVDYKVKVTGDVKGDSITVQQIAKAD